jgi:hypothetical protein
VSRFEALKGKWKKAGLTIGFRQCRAFIGAGEHKEMEWVVKLEARSGWGEAEHRRRLISRPAFFHPQHLGDFSAAIVGPAAA